MKQQLSKKQIKLLLSTILYLQVPNEIKLRFPTLPTIILYQ